MATFAHDPLIGAHGDIDDCLPVSRFEDVTPGFGPYTTPMM
jgi:hypothetical protein